FEAPARAFADALAQPSPARRVAFTPDFGGRVLVERETREICANAARIFEELGATVEEASPDLGDIEAAFLALRSQHYVVDRELMLKSHRSLLKPDIVWNTEIGLEQTSSQIAAAERERAALYRRVAEFFATFDLLVSPGASTPAFDVNLRMPAAIDGHKLETYLGASLITAATTMMALPSLAVPCGFDRYGRPVGLQLIGRHRAEAELIQAGALFEAATGLSPLLPIDPKPRMVPPAWAGRGAHAEGAMRPGPIYEPPRVAPRPGETVVTSLRGHNCGGRCVVNAHVIEGRIARISSDPTRWNPELPPLQACARGFGQIERVYHPDRLQHPLRRVGKRGGGRFERISWDEALNEVARQMLRVRARYGNAAILDASRSGSLSALHGSTSAQRFLYMFGGCTELWSNMSAEAEVFAVRMTYGAKAVYKSAGREPTDYVNSKLLLLWGWSPGDGTFGTGTWQYLRLAKKRGARVIC